MGRQKRLESFCPLASMKREREGCRPDNVDGRGRHNEVDTRLPNCLQMVGETSFETRKLFSKLLTRSRRNQPESNGVNEGMVTEAVD
jgi:hypothetical protein